MFGGEPFLHLQLADTIKYLGTCYADKIGQIVIITNGTVLPKQELLKILQKYKVSLSISDYTAINPYADILSNLLSELDKYEMRDIVLFTDGSSKRCYLYTMDAVFAILTIMLSGEAGKAYKAANPDTYCSVKGMASMVATQIANSQIRVIISEDLERSKKFSSLHFNYLDVGELGQLGWRANKSLMNMYKSMIEGWQDESCN